MSTAKYALAAVFVACSLTGFLTTIGALRHNGFGPAIEFVVKGHLDTVPGAPSPFKREFTGYAGLDGFLSTLVGFFGAFLHGDGNEGRHVWFLWAMAQFGAGWTMLMLEGRRAGNRGRLVSFVSVFGLLFQTATWTVIVPLYCAIHLFTSPVASIPDSPSPSDRGVHARRSLFVLLWDLAVLPMTVTATFLLPTAMMMLPELLGHTTSTHWTWVAIWQAFPLWGSLLQGFLHGLCYYALGSLTPRDDAGEPTARPGKAYLVAASGVYEFALTLCLATHLPLVLLTLAPSDIRSSLLSSLPPSIFPDYLTLDLAGLDDAALSFSSVFVPKVPILGPSLAALLPSSGLQPVDLSIDPSSWPSGILAPLVINFLQYDLYIGTSALLLWAAYLRQVTVRGASVVGLVAKLGLWVVLAGPAGAVVMLLWERDGAVTDGEENEEPQKKTN